ncbi:MAG: hypothetical protein JWN67_1565 [Actinomycetia bacterium]|nr:hypothetical protein [Actinomycetes bacterium]
MRRRLTLAATWLATTVLATFVVSLGVHVVTSEVTTRRPAPLALVRAAATTTTTSTTVAPTTTSTTVPPATTSTVRRPTTTTAVPATVRTANGRGGSVSVRFTRTSVSLVVATPSPGYAVSVFDDGPRSVSVVFRTDDHVTRVFARAGDDRISLDEDDDGHDDGGGHGGPGRR